MTLATSALGPASSPDSWRTFFTLTGTAAATLTGFVVMPGQSRTVLAAEILFVSVGCVGYTAWPVLQTVRSAGPGAPADLALRWLAMAATWLLSIGAGISLLAGHGGGLYLLAFGLLLGIALLVAAAWTLVVEAGNETRGTDTGSAQVQPDGPPATGRPEHRP